MCGIAGVVRTDADARIDESMLLRMAAAIRHRGPDGFGLAIDHGAGLVSTRLAIFDIEGGWQPLATERSALVYNGEVYNHPELAAELTRAGASLRTTCDTEVVHRLLERDGLAALDRLNGQFVIAWWEPTERRLTLIRDRFGVRPLYFATLADGSLVFGSEVKAILASGLVPAAPDPEGIDEIFTLWGPRPPRTPFAGISQVAPGGVLVWERGEIVSDRRWWTPDVAGAPDDRATAGELEDLLRESIRLRLRADVPVGTYLSGGLDSSLITAIAQQETTHQLRTFSLAFSDSRFDERAHQEEVAAAIGTDHHVVEIGSQEIAGALPDVVEHTEAPLIRTAPVPMYLLAQRVREQDITVVATGEGADELFWGYDLFKEVALREIAETDPARAETLLDDLYGYLGPEAARRGPAWKRFILETGAGDDPIGSHMTRIGATAAVKSFYSEEMAAAIGDQAAAQRVRAAMPDAAAGWSKLERAGWLEITTLMEPYLLSVQGDRVAMAHGVEGRYPFLDHRVFDCSARLPPELKLDQMTDKAVLRDIAKRVLPVSIADRAKQPYRAPAIAPFFGADAPDWVEDVLDRSALRATGIWDPERVEVLLRRCRTGKATGAREEMAFVGIVTTQLWHRAFADRDRNWPAEAEEPRVRVDLRTRTIEGQGAGI